MIRINLYTISTVFVFLLVSTLSFADISYICSNAGFERRIAIKYQNASNSVPCEVVYDKGEGAQILWFADNELGYCEEKAEDFVEKQESWGWSCLEENAEEIDSAATAAQEELSEAQESTDISLSDEIDPDSIPSESEVDSAVSNEITE